MAKFPIHPKHPERICWGCEKMCPADDLCCGNGKIRAAHPVELIGDDWWKEEQERFSQADVEAENAPQPPPA